MVTAYYGALRRREQEPSTPSAFGVKADIQLMSSSARLRASDCQLHHNVALQFLAHVEIVVRKRHKAGLFVKLNGFDILIPNTKPQPIQVR